ncbi:hypothetical protein ACA910_005281 [Epithemia clementina (nom. ined.)]
MAGRIPVSPPILVVPSHDNNSHSIQEQEHHYLTDEAANTGALLLRNLLYQQQERQQGGVAASAAVGAAAALNSSHNTTASHGRGGGRLLNATIAASGGDVLLPVHGGGGGAGSLPAFSTAGGARAPPPPQTARTPSLGAAGTAPDDASAIIRALSGFVVPPGTSGGWVATTSAPVQRPASVGGGAVPNGAGHSPNPRSTVTPFSSTATAAVRSDIGAVSASANAAASLSSAAAAVDPKNDLSQLPFLRERVRQHVQRVIQCLPYEQTRAYRQAMARDAALVQSETDPLHFVRYCGYDVLAGAQRLCLYWTERLQLFGSERAFLPLILTGTGALTPEDLLSLRGGFPSLLPCNAQTGQSVIFFDRRTIIPNITRDHLLRGLFYIFKVLAENDASQVQGAILLGATATPRSKGAHDVDWQYTRRAITYICTIFPVQVSIHLMSLPQKKSPVLAAKLVDAFVSVLQQYFRFAGGWSSFNNNKEQYSQTNHHHHNDKNNDDKNFDKSHAASAAASNSTRGAQMFQVHVQTPDGPPIKILEELLELGLTKQGVPHTYGGEWTLRNFHDWCQERMEWEQETYQERLSLAAAVLDKTSSTAPTKTTISGAGATDVGGAGAPPSTISWSPIPKHGMKNPPPAASPGAAATTTPSPTKPGASTSSPSSSFLAGGGGASGGGFWVAGGHSNVVNSGLVGGFGAGGSDSFGMFQPRTSVAALDPHVLGMAAATVDATTSAAAPPLSLLSDEERAAKRRMEDLIRSRRKRERHRIEFEELKQDSARLVEENKRLVTERDRLTRLWTEAEQCVAQLSCGGDAASVAEQHPEGGTTGEGRGEGPNGGFFL